jgi:hypothetical protein
MILYKKVGRRYVPFSEWERLEGDSMKVGTWRMTYAYSDGGRRFSYDVKPDTASFVAACQLAQIAMEKAISDMASAKPSALVKYTKPQIALVNKFRADMNSVGGLVPDYWVHESSHAIVEAGIKAVREWKE